MLYVLLDIIFSAITLTPCPHLEEPFPLASAEQVVKWEGLYIGSIPCQNCEDIHVELKIHRNFQFNVLYQYKNEQAVQESGDFSWDKQIITLKNTSLPVLQFKIHKEKLIPITQSGKEKFYLQKEKSYNTVTNKYWHLVEFYGSPPVNDDKKEPHFILKEKNRITGSGGCNTFNGEYRLGRKNKITISSLTSTKTACPDKPSEDRMYYALGNANRYSVMADTLFLYNEQEKLARFEALYFK